MGTIGNGLNHLKEMIHSDLYKVLSNKEKFKQLILKLFV